MAREIEILIPVASLRKTLDILKLWFVGDQGGVEVVKRGLEWLGLVAQVEAEDVVQVGQGGEVVARKAPIANGIDVGRHGGSFRQHDSLIGGREDGLCSIGGGKGGGAEVTVCRADGRSGKEIRQ